MTRAGETGLQFTRGDSQSNLAGAGVTEAAGTDGDLVLIGFLFDKAMVDHPAVGVEKIQSNGSAAVFGPAGTIDFEYGGTIAVVDALQFLQ